MCEKLIFSYFLFKKCVIVLSYTEENNQMNYSVKESRSNYLGAVCELRALNKKWLDILDFFDWTPILILMIS